MAMKSFRKVNTKLKCLYRQNEFLNSKLRRFLCNSLIHPHFDCACISLYPLSSHKMSKKLQITRNKCVLFLKKLNSRWHSGAKKFQEINWLPKKRVAQRVATNVFKYCKETSPFYVNELFVPTRDTYNTRSHMALEIPLRKSSLGKKSISFIGLSI